MESKKAKKEQPFRLLAVAPSGTGKTYTVTGYIVDLIAQKAFHPKRIVVFSPTAASDPSMEKMIKECIKKYPKWKEHNLFAEGIDESFIEQLIGTQKEIAEKAGREKNKPWLLIFDDVVGEATLCAKRGALITLATQGRHWSISTVVLLQAYRGVCSPIIRQQTTKLLIGRLQSMAEVSDIAEQYSQGLDRDPKQAKIKMLNLLEDSFALEDGHGFLLINTSVQYGKGRLRQGIKGSFVDV